MQAHTDNTDRQATEAQIRYFCNHNCLLASEHPSGRLFHDVSTDTNTNTNTNTGDATTPQQEREVALLG